MRTSTRSAIATGLFLPAVAHAAGVVQWDIHKKHHPAYRLGRRAATTKQEVINNYVSRGGYFATCSLGTPPQELVLQLDTGSSDIWVPSSQAEVCSEGDCTLGTCTYRSLFFFGRPTGEPALTSCILVDPDASSTFNDTAFEFEITYVDGSYSKGDYFTDAFQIADTSLTNLTMGLGNDTSIAYGLVGVGYTSNEAIISTEQSLAAAYSNLPALMVDQGAIATNAYSLWLNDLDASTGSILFGGIDTEKYVGEMTTIDIVKDNETGEYDSFIVLLTSMQAVSSSGTDDLTSQSYPIPVVLDSGTTLSYLPNDIAQQIWTEAGAVYTASVGLALVPCRMQRSTGHFTFAFAGPNGPTIDVKMDELVLDLVISGPAPTFSAGEYKGEDACEFGIQNTTGINLLGDTFLRSAYVVYDLENNQIGMAATDFNATDSNIVAFASKGAAIPSATAAANQSQATATSAFTQPAFAAEAGFANGTESGASSLFAATARGGVPLALGLTGLTMVVSFALGGGVFLL